MLSEFDLIKHYFVRPVPGRATLGIGDDCALLAPAPGMQTAISSDMLVEGRHFFAGEDAQRLGHKSLAVNLSDLAAMGARPVAFTLALALPGADRAWLEGFARGLFALADAHGCELIGGDTTKGPLNICITVLGEVAPGRALRRDAAQAGDEVWVSGTLGDARLALAGYRGEVALAPDAQAAAGTRMHTPTPRVALGLLLAERGLARAAIDVSDGLVGDLGHILERSGVGATLDADALPAGPVLAGQPRALRRAFTAAGGDDYELCFTAPAAARAAILEAAAACGTPVTRIGRIDAAPGLRWTDAHGAPLALELSSFDHFTQ
ncbi:MAG: thiL [Pseudoduganella sp.]|jgi:thiamine-monophosphate kinase|nr:thiL [Pseudoduganella sp.]